MRYLCTPILLAVLLTGCSGARNQQAEVNQLLAEYTQTTQPAWKDWHENAWLVHTHVIEGIQDQAAKAVSAYAAWQRAVGEPRFARKARDLTQSASTHGLPLRDADEAALQAIRTLAKRYPATDPALLQNYDRLAGADARLRVRVRPIFDNESIHTSELAAFYNGIDDLELRGQIWDALMATGERIRPSFFQLRDLRNEIARKGGWDNQIDRESAIYGFNQATSTEFAQNVVRDLQPLYRALHTWVRHELASHHGLPEPEQIPVHWLPTPLANDWSGIIHTNSEAITEALAAQGAPQMLREVESLYTGFGLNALPEAFWTRSDLFPADPSQPFQKSLAASTWDIDLAGDVRILLSAKAVPADWHQAIREFGFAHAYMERTQAGLPLPLRELPTSAVQGAIGTWADLIAFRPTHLQAAGLLPAGEVDGTRTLLEEALTTLPALLFSAGVAIPWEDAVYAGNLSPNQANQVFWRQMADVLGVVPPSTRSDRLADPLLFNQFHDLPGRSLDPLLSILLAFQLHMHLCEQLGLDPHNADLAHKGEVGQAMSALAIDGSTRPFGEVVRTLTGQPLDASAVVQYFEPLRQWLDAQNASHAANPPAQP